VLRSDLRPGCVDEVVIWPEEQRRLVMGSVATISATIVITPVWLIAVCAFLDGRIPGCPIRSRKAAGGHHVYRERRESSFYCIVALTQFCQQSGEYSKGRASRRVINLNRGR